MIQITRENVDEILDAGKLYVGMRNGRWWQARRNGQTKRWKKNPSRIRVSIKFGFRLTDQLFESAFDGAGALNSAHFRHVDDVPRELRP